RLQPHFFVVHESQRAHAIPFHFEEPVIPARRLVHQRRFHRLDRGRHFRFAGALYGAELDFRFFLTSAVVLAGAVGASAAGATAFRPRAAGRLLAHTRSAAPAVLRLVLRAGRLRAISSCVRPESTLYACSSTSHPGTAKSSRFLRSSHSFPLPRPFMWTSAKSPFSFCPCRRNFKSPRASCASPGISPSSSN